LQNPENQEKRCSFIFFTLNVAKKSTRKAVKTTQKKLKCFDNVPESLDCDFTVICPDDSMNLERITQGDVVYIKAQPDIENGDIAVCTIDGMFDDKAVLRKVFIFDDRIVLQSAHYCLKSSSLNYDPLVFFDKDVSRVHILGKAVGFTSKIKKPLVATSD
jgi:repressor LexA